MGVSTCCQELEKEAEKQFPSSEGMLQEWDNSGRYNRTGVGGEERDGTEMRRSGREAIEEEQTMKERKTYTTMSTICTTALFGGLVHLDVLDDQVSSIQALCICIRFRVLEEAE